MTHPMSRRRFALQVSAAFATLGFGGAARAPIWRQVDGQQEAQAGQSPRRGPRVPLGEGTLSDEFLHRLPELMEYADVAGVAIAIVRDGHVAWTRELGVKDAQSRLPVAGTTIFQVASLGKPLFAYVVLRLHEEGLIDIDRPLHEYLPFPDLDTDAGGKLISGRHVLSHTTGLQNWRRSNQQKLVLSFPPGKRFGYSGEGFYHLQCVLETITGRGIDDLVRERLFEPLGMNTSSYFWLPEHAGLIAAGHGFGGSPSPAWSAQLGPRMLERATSAGTPLSTWRHQDVVEAFQQIAPDTPSVPNYLIPNVAGSLLTTAEEYARFLARMLGDVGGVKFALSETTRHDMLSPQVRINGALSYGLGWALEHVEGRDYFWHWGDNGSFKAFTIGEPARRWGIVILTNSAGGTRLSNLIVRETTGRDHPAFLWEMVS